MIDAAVGNPTKHQKCVGLAGVLDAGPAVMRIVLTQIREIVVDGVGVDIDEPYMGGLTSVDSHDSVQ